jgi:hypothetical protein
MKTEPVVVDAGHTGEGEGEGDIEDILFCKRGKSFYSSPCAPVSMELVSWSNLCSSVEQDIVADGRELRLVLGAVRGREERYAECLGHALHSYLLSSS